MEEQEQNKLMRTYEILDRRHIHDEGLLISRTANFLLVNSFLAVAFAAFVTQGESFRCFSLVLPCIGIVMCIAFYFLLRMQLLTARLWLDMEWEIEDMKIFPSSEKGELAPNRRHGDFTKNRPWMWPSWTFGSTVLTINIFGMWIAFLVLVLS